MQHNDRKSLNKLVKYLLKNTPKLLSKGEGALASPPFQVLFTGEGFRERLKTLNHQLYF